jgi:hypothetical protein
MDKNMLLLMSELTDEDLRNITEALRRYPPSNQGFIDYTQPAVIGLLPRERVIVALQVYGTTAALRLACKLLKAQYGR